MSNITDRQTVIVSVSLILMNTVTGNPSHIQLPINLRFAADELIVKNITYNNNFSVTPDVSNTVLIWCNLTNDGLIGVFPNSVNCSYHRDDHFRLNNTFQTGNIIMQFLQSDTANPATYNPQPLISAQAPQETFGSVSITLEFVKHSK